MPKEQPPSAGELRAVAALDQLGGRAEELGRAFLVEYSRADRAEEQLRAFLAGDRLIEHELREQLATSERMRAELSCELQLVRAQLMLCRELASGAIMEEYRALHELSELGYLNQVAYERMASLQSWLAVYGTP